MMLMSKYTRHIYEQSQKKWDWRNDKRENKREWVWPRLAEGKRASPAFDRGILTSTVWSRAINARFTREGAICAHVRREEASLRADKPANQQSEPGWLTGQKRAAILIHITEVSCTKISRSRKRSWFCVSSLGRRSAPFYCVLCALNSHPSIYVKEAKFSLSLSFALALPRFFLTFTFTLFWTRSVDRYLHVAAW